MKDTASIGLGKNRDGNRVWWVNRESLVISISEKFGMLAKPQPTGELYAINADGSDAEILVGQRVAGFSTGTRLNSKPNERIAAFLVDDRRDDDKGVVIAEWPFSYAPYTRARRLEVYSRRRAAVSRERTQ